MNLNATLIGEMVTFFLFALFTMKYVWPPIMQVLEKRQEEIARGLAASELGVQKLELASEQVKNYLHEAREKSAELLEKARYQAEVIIEEARAEAVVAQQQELKKAITEIERLKQEARQELKMQMSQLIVMGAEKIIQKSLDAKMHQQLIDDLIDKV